MRDSQKSLRLIPVWQALIVPPLSEAFQQNLGLIEMSILWPRLAKAALGPMYGMSSLQTTKALDHPSETSFAPMTMASGLGLSSVLDYLEALKFTRTRQSMSVKRSLHIEGLQMA